MTANCKIVEVLTKVLVRNGHAGGRGEGETGRTVMQLCSLFMYG